MTLSSRGGMTRGRSLQSMPSSIKCNFHCFDAIREFETKGDKYNYPYTTEIVECTFALVADGQWFYIICSETRHTQEPTQYGEFNLGY